MSQGSRASASLSRWRELSPEIRAALDRKLKGLYGAESDESAFDSLSLDKQQALLILRRRLRELGVWETAVRRVTNVYGEGGVGMNFDAWPVLASTLRAHPDFTTRFARHGDTSGGFLEKGKTHASLHFLYVDNGKRQWATHFDLYNPWASPLNAWRHLWREKIRHQTPDWRIISESLWDVEERNF